MAVAAYFAGVRLSGEDGSESRSAIRGAVIVAAAPALVLLVFVILLAYNVAWRVRIEDNRLIGVGVLGPVAVDLESLAGVKDSTSRQGQSLALRDDQQTMMVSLKTLRQHQALEQVAAAVRWRQDNGGVTLSRGAAGILRVPVSTGTGPRPPRTQLIVTLGAVLVFFAALIV